MRMGFDPPFVFPLERKRKRRAGETSETMLATRKARDITVDLPPRAPGSDWSISRCQTVAEEEAGSCVPHTNRVALIGPSRRRSGLCRPGPPPFRALIGIPYCLSNRRPGEWAERRVQSPLRILIGPFRCLASHRPGEVGGTACELERMEPWVHGRH
ncbi:hypothetical protein chiPu_0015115 [Chiloscyllium punctatum]|uniref:Uncharacterized protein n=1 Tax=Chiloscyllium punctatum TaxID=137246 RepID=A0A401T1W2_CHIPU|nr:hypothetical protein [Chiloscyllium punctatum]